MMKHGAALNGGSHDLALIASTVVNSRIFASFEMTFGRYARKCRSFILVFWIAQDGTLSMYKFSLRENIVSQQGP